MYTKDEILKRLKPGNLEVIIEDCLPSTNTTLKEMAERGASEGTVLLARSQSAGRGRRGHSFYSPENTGIYMSILLKPNLPVQDALKITTAAAVAVAEAITAQSGIPAKIKWVNDIYCFQKKVCGILTESALTPDGTGLRYAVLGIGINVLPPKEDFPEDFRHNATSILTQTQQNFEDSLIADILNRFFGLYKDLNHPGILAQYKTLSCLIGETVDVLGHNLYGTVTDIDEEYHLIIKDGNGTLHALDSGEVSIRKRA